MLIVLKQNYLQALERIEIYDQWTTIILMVLFGVVFLLKGVSSSKLQGYAFSLFNKGFIEKEVEENSNFFNFFYIAISLFSITVLALLLHDLKGLNSNRSYEGITEFWTVLVSLLLYFYGKWFLEYVFAALFLIKKEVQFFLISKASYLFANSFLLFIAFVLFQYSELNASYLYYFTVFLFAIRFLVHFLNNKNLIFNKLFYFILYLCAFEIAPLFVLFKLIL